MLGKLDGFPKRTTFLSEEKQKFLGTSRFGGDFVLPTSLLESSKDAKRCPVCSEAMTLVIYLCYLDEETKEYRLLYLFCCTQAALRNEEKSTMSLDSNHTLSDPSTWRAFCVCIPPKSKQVAPEWSPDCLWESGEKEQDGINLIASLEKLGITPTVESFVPFHHPFRVDHEDSLGKMEFSTVSLGTLPSIRIDLRRSYFQQKPQSLLDTHVKQLMLDYDERVANGLEDDDSDDLSDDSSDDANTSDVESCQEELIEDYQNRMNEYIPHVVRHEWCGRPLFPGPPRWNPRYTPHPEQGSHGHHFRPPCSHCLAPCVFEFQITPLLFHQLTLLSHHQNVSSELKTFVKNTTELACLVVFSCSKNCCQSPSPTELRLTELSVAVCPLI